MKLRNEYKGVIITRMIPGIGEITFDPFLVKEDDYNNFYNLGFEFIFEIESEGRKNSIKNKIKNSSIVK